MMDYKTKQNTSYSAPKIEAIYNWWHKRWSFVFWNPVGENWSTTRATEPLKQCWYNCIHIHLFIFYIGILIPQTIQLVLEKWGIDKSAHKGWLAWEVILLQSTSSLHQWSLLLQIYELYFLLWDLMTFRTKTYSKSFQQLSYPIRISVTQIVPNRRVIA